MAVYPKHKSAASSVCLLILLLMLPPLTSSSRLSPAWSYKDLVEAANVVIIAEPVSSRDTDEHTTLRELDPSPAVVGVETEFKILAVLKGDEKLSKLIMHHYKLADPDVAHVNGPELIAFDPHKSTAFLLFLLKEPDGRYAPVSGQIAPTEFSVIKLGTN